MKLFVSINSHIQLLEANYYAIRRSNLLYKNHKLTRGLCFNTLAKNLRHVSPQNRFTFKEFKTTTREIGLIIFPDMIISNCWP